VLELGSSWLALLGLLGVPPCYPGSSEAWDRPDRVPAWGIRSLAAPLGAPKEVSIRAF